MKRSDWLVLAAIQLGLVLLVAPYQRIPGNIDADYYFMGGLRLVQGHGFTENYIWNYFNDIAALPQPSHGYWMPLASLFTAVGMVLTGSQTFAAGRLAFIFLAALMPPLTAALAYRLTTRRDLAFLAGLVAICSGFYFPYLSVTENYSIFMVLGALYFLTLHRTPPSAYFILGVLSGLLSLARSDGLLWLLLTLLLIAVRWWQEGQPRLTKPQLAMLTTNLLLALSGFLLIMLPWFLRNLSVFGSIMPPGTRRTLWLTEYYQTFIYPGSAITLESWLASGWDAILAVRMDAIARAINNIFIVQGVLVLMPFMLLGAWTLRKDARVRMGFLAWLGLIIAFTVVFPLAGIRGSYIHAVCAIQPLLYALVPVGLQTLLERIQRRRPARLPHLNLIVHGALIALAGFVTYSSVTALVFVNGWQRGELTYPAVEAFLVQQGIRPDEPVMVVNPPGYTMMTERPAVMFPYGGEDSVLGVAEKFQVRFIAIKGDSVNSNAHFNALYDQPDLYPAVELVGQVDDVKVYRVKATP